LLLIYLANAGCKNNWTSTGPNFPTFDQNTPRIVFPITVLGTIGETGGDLGNTGGMMSQYFTQASLAQQYTDIDSYSLTTVDRFVTGPWEDISERT